jgi:Leucine-rich repeat (LRR) protein
MSNSKAIALLREKIATLQEAWAISADAAQKFAYQKQIEQAEAELATLMAKSKKEAHFSENAKRTNFLKDKKNYLFFILSIFLCSGTFLFFKKFSLEKKGKKESVNFSSIPTSNADTTANLPTSLPTETMESLPAPLSAADLAREPLFYRLPDKSEKGTRLYRLHLSAEDFKDLISKDEEKIAFFSEKIKSLKSLQSLSFAETLPLSPDEWELFFKSLATLPFLSHLDLSYQRLEKLPTSLFLCQDLKVLNLSGNLLQSLPDEIKNLKQLQQLYLNQNQITTLPPALASLPALERLYLLENAPLSTAAFQVLAQMPALSRLQVAIKKPQTLNFALASLQNKPNLQHLELDLTALDFRSFPPALQKLQNIEALHLRLTPSSQMGDIFQKLALMPRLKRLHLRLSGSPYLSQEILKVKQIEILYLTHEQHLDPANLAEKVSQLPHLQKLILTQKQKITAFPPQWKRLDKIEVIQKEWTK